MRVFILILLIALAPLRGIANELMATRMATGLTASAAGHASHPVHDTSSHHCEDMAQAPHHAAEPAGPTASHDGCDNCSLCQMCASAALPAEFPLTLPVFGAQPLLPAPTERFASAPAALAQKPPIS